MTNKDKENEDLSSISPTQPLGGEDEDVEQSINDVAVHADDEQHQRGGKVNDKKESSQAKNSSLLEEKQRLTRGRVAVGVQLEPLTPPPEPSLDDVVGGVNINVSQPSQSSSLLEEKERLTRGRVKRDRAVGPEKEMVTPGAQRVSNQDQAGESSLVKNNPKLSLAPGAHGVVSESHGGVSSGGEKSDKDLAHNAMEAVGDIESNNNDNNNNNLIEAEVALDMDELVESEVQKRMKTLEQQREEEERQNIVVADAVEEEDTGSSKKLWICIVIVVVVIAAVAIGVSQSKSGVEKVVPAPPTTKAPTLSPSTAPTLTPPTQSPTLALRTRVEAILAPYAPLDQQTMNWLTNTSTWQPDEGDPNYDYLWLERYAMAHLYFSTNGNDWSFNDNWLSDEPVCNWYSRSFRPCPGLMENIHMDERGLRGTIPPVLFEMSALTHLSLNANQLWGSIPSTIGNLKSIEWMRLDDNQLTGTIPTEIGKLSNIENLELQNNELTGTVPLLPSSLSGSLECRLEGNCFDNLNNLKFIPACRPYINCGQWL